VPRPRTVESPMTLLLWLAAALVALWLGIKFFFKAVGCAVHLLLLLALAAVVWWFMSQR
jgi:hypothetical protein